MERFNDATGKYENTNAINIAPQPTEDEREGILTADTLAECQSTLSTLNQELTYSTSFLDNTIQAEAAHKVEIESIQNNANLNPVEKQTRISVLANKNKHLPEQMKLAQNAVDGDTDLVRKATGKMLIAKNNHEAQLAKISNTPTPEKVAEYKTMKRSTMDEATRMEIVDKMGFEFYKTLPLV